jgi:hypothetical protein
MQQSDDEQAAAHGAPYSESTGVDLLASLEEVCHPHAERLGELHDLSERWTPLATQDLRQVAL